MFNKIVKLQQPKNKATALDKPLGGAAQIVANMPPFWIYNQA